MAASVNGFGKFFDDQSNNEEKDREKETREEETRRGEDIPPPGSGFDLGDTVAEDPPPGSAFDLGDTVAEDPPQEGGQPETVIDDRPRPQPSKKVLANRWEIEKRIGKGGMGTVFLARDLKINRPVAVKMMNPKLIENPKAWSRFDREGKMARDLDHPHIVSIYDRGFYEGKPFIVFKFVQGMTLQYSLDNEKITPAGHLALLVKVAQTMAYVHSKKIIHRDLKPDNILIDQEGHPYVSDFGTAKNLLADSSLTLTGATIGTYYYMSPEQQAGKSDIDYRCDIYALGIMAYQIVTGEVPKPRILDFAGQKDKILRPQKINPRVSKDLEKIIQKATAILPQYRYQSAESFARHLQKCLEEGPFADPGSTREKPDFSRPQKNPFPLILAGVFLVAALLGGVLWMTGGEKGKEEKVEITEEDPPPPDEENPPKVKDLLGWGWTGKMGGADFHGRYGKKNKTIHGPPVYRRKWKVDLRKLHSSPPKKNWKYQYPVFTGEISRKNPGLEIVLAMEGKVFLLSREGRKIHGFNWPGQADFILYFLSDVDGDGQVDICLATKSAPDRSQWAFFNHQGKLLFQGGMKVASDGGFEPRLVLEVKGRKRLFGRLVAGHEKKPRGMACFDVKSGLKLYSYLTGGLAAIEGVWKDGEDYKIIITGTTAMNGAWGKGVNKQATVTTDNTVHMVVANHRGEEIFTVNGFCPDRGRRDRAGLEARFFQPEKRDSPLIFVSHGHNPRYRQYHGLARVMIYNLKGQKIREQTVKRNIGSGLLLVGKVNKWGTAFVSRWGDGILRIWDEKLKVRNQFQTGFHPQILADINGDGLMEIAGNEGKRLVIWNGELNSLYESPLFENTPEVIPSDFEGDGQIELVVKNGSYLELWEQKE